MQQLKIGDEVNYRGRVWGVVKVARGRLDLRTGGGFRPHEYASTSPAAVRFVRGATTRRRGEPEFDAEATVQRFIADAMEIGRRNHAERVRAADVAASAEPSVVAFHEAGHLTAAWALGATVNGATVVPEGGVDGRAWYDPDTLIAGSTRGAMQAVVCLAGRLGERRAPGWRDELELSTGHEDDAATALRCLDGDRDALRAVERYAEALLAKNSVQLAVLADELESRGAMLGDEVTRTLETALVRATRAGLVVVRSGRPSVEERSARFALDAERSDGLTLTGYAAVFDVPTTIRDQAGDFDEVISRGAFARSLRERTPVLMFEHGRHPVIGTMPLGVVESAVEDSRGLHVTARLTDNWMVQPVRDAVRDGAVSGMSFRFSVPVGGDRWQTRSGKPDLRTVVDADVTELGPVVFPAYRTTSVSVRAGAAA